MRNQTSGLRIVPSDALPLSHRDPMVSEDFYEEVYNEVTFSIPHEDSECFPFPTLLTRKNLSLVQWKF